MRTFVVVLVAFGLMLALMVMTVVALELFEHWAEDGGQTETGHALGAGLASWPTRLTAAPISAVS